ncbi:unnamed protein product [Ectocarpus sp. CCAP 1310/34]|nr:unnamed protein product [Ectocarpus sp. CCAP 1310/34]
MPAGAAVSAATPAATAVASGGSVLSAAVAATTTGAPALALGAAASATAPAVTAVTRDGVDHTISVGGAASAPTEAMGAPRATAAKEAVVADVNEHLPNVVTMTGGGSQRRRQRQPEDSCNDATVVDIDNGSDYGGWHAGEVCDGWDDSGCGERGASTHPFDPEPCLRGCAAPAIAGRTTWWMDPAAASATTEREWMWSGFGHCCALPAGGNGGL